MNFTTEQLKLIFTAVRYYQINGVPLSSQRYNDCSDILDYIFPVAKDVTVPNPSSLSTDPTSIPYDSGDKQSHS
jgi:hypothetical protein